MSAQTYAAPGPEDSVAGKAILMIVSPICALLVLLGLFYWTGASGRHQAAVEVSGCEVSLFIATLPCITQPMVVSQYDAIVNPATKLLNDDGAAYTANEKGDLVAAEAALTSEVATEQSLDNNLTAALFTPANRANTLAQLTQAASSGGNIPMSAITFTPKQTVIAQALVQAVQTLAALTTKQARSTSLAAMRSFDAQSTTDTTAAQDELKLLLNAVNASPQDG
jgi:hypothetical protein